MSHKNLQWAKEYALSKDPSFKFRWELYDELLLNNLNTNINWLDIGCGNNSDIDQLGIKTAFACGVDLVIPPSAEQPIVTADITQLPFADNSIDFISLRFVVEHLEFPQKAFYEMHRVLTKNGKILIMTTNLSSPFIFFPRILPYKIKEFLLKKIFGGHSEDIFPTYHRINRKKDYDNLIDKFSIEQFDYIQDTNITRKWLFKLTYHLARISKKSRTNIITTLKKS